MPDVAKRVLTAACLVVCAAAALGGSPPQEQLAWLPSLAAAQDDAKQRKVPMLVVLNMDGERGNEAMLGEVYTAPAVREAAKKCAVTIASLGRHAEVDDPKSGHKVCAKFGRVTCDEHRAVEKTVREEWLKRGPKDDVESPRHIFRAPDGRALFERVWTIDADELVKLIDRAVAACAPDSLAAWDTTDARLARAFEPLRCVRRSALKDLLAAHDAAADAKLLDLVKKTDNDEAAADAVSALAEDPTPARVDGVKKLLAAPSAVVRSHAAAALASMHDKDAFALLSAALDREKPGETKCVMLRALAVCGGDPAKTRDALLHHAKGEDALLRVHAVVALVPWAKEDAVVDAVRKWPANDKLPDNLRAAAAWLLGFSEKKDVAEELRAVAAERDKPDKSKHPGPKGAPKWDVVKIACDAAAARLSGTGDDEKYRGLREWIAPLKVPLAEATSK